MKLTRKEIEMLKKRMKIYDKMEALYNENEAFKIFVDKCCKSQKIDKEICLLHKTVQEVGLYYISKETELVPVNPKDAEPVFEEDKSC